MIAVLPPVTDASDWTSRFGCIHSVAVKLVLLNPTILRIQLKGLEKICELLRYICSKWEFCTYCRCSSLKQVQQVWFAWVSSLNLEKNSLHLAEQEPAAFLLIHMHVWSCRVGRNWADALSKCNLNNRFNYTPWTGVSSLWQTCSNFHCTI